MDYGVLLRCTSVYLRCTSVYFSGLQWTRVYFGVQQCTSEKFSKIQLNSAPLLVTTPDCDALSEVSTGRSWQLVFSSFCLCLLVLSLSSYRTFTCGNFIRVVHILLVLLSCGNLRHPEWLSRLYFLLSCLSFASEDCTLFCCLSLFVCLKQPVTGSAVTSCCRVIDLWSTFHQSFCLHFIFSGDVIYNFSLQS